MNLSNYLFFTTNCEQALTFYTECGLGKVISTVRHGEHGMAVRTESMRGKIMHAQFEGPGIRFFASDNDDAEPMRGSAMIFMLDDRDQTKRLFTRLAAGGQVTTPLAVQPWGDYFGKLTDRPVWCAMDVQLHTKSVTSLELLPRHPHRCRWPGQFHILYEIDLPVHFQPEN